MCVLVYEYVRAFVATNASGNELQVYLNGKCDLQFCCAG